MITPFLDHAHGYPRPKNIRWIVTWLRWASCVSPSPRRQQCTRSADPSIRSEPHVGPAIPALKQTREYSPAVSPDDMGAIGEEEEEEEERARKHGIRKLLSPLPQLFLVPEHGVVRIQASFYFRSQRIERRPAGGKTPRAADTNVHKQLPPPRLLQDTDTCCPPSVSPTKSLPQPYDASSLLYPPPFA